jgi:hypothetical protein
MVSATVAASLSGKEQLLSNFLPDWPDIMEDEADGNDP